MREHFDAVIVGSGFGGSVMAARLAEAGMGVLVLERGKAYPPGSFPRSPREMEGNFWDPSEGLHGLFDVWSFFGLDAIVASGLGGGSLIYANVLLRKDERWFEGWPLSRRDLDPHYAAVERVLQPALYPAGLPFDVPKVQGFRKAAERVIARDNQQPPCRHRGIQLVPAPLAVTFARQGAAPAPGQQLPYDPCSIHRIDTDTGLPRPFATVHRRSTCRLCGECDIGCNYGSKNTLDHTFLSRAFARGAQVRTRCQVRELARRATGRGYEVRYVVHKREAEGCRTRTRKLPLHEVTCDYLVLAAGTLGSTYLLLQNRERLGLQPGAPLGHRFSTNGDVLGVALDCRLGPLETSTPVGASRAPVITSALRVDDADDGGNGPGLYLQDGGYPGHLDWFGQALSVPGQLRRYSALFERYVLGLLGLSPSHSLSVALSRSIAAAPITFSSLPLLAMGRDTPDGVMSIQRRRLKIRWRRRTSRAHFARAEALCAEVAEALGGRLSKAAALAHQGLDRAITVHPLGGCPMGTSALTGVIDTYGRVYGHDSLYVADGSVMPGPVGANPSLTIAALADRFADDCLARWKGGGTATRPTRATTATIPGATPAPAPPPAPLPAAPGPPSSRADRLTFRERMEGPFALGETDPFRGAAIGKCRGQALALELDVDLADVDAFLLDPQHRTRLSGTVSGVAVGGETLPVNGTLDLLVAGDRPGHRRMTYRVAFTTAKGAWRLDGVKDVEDDPGFDAWRDTTTLYTRLYRQGVAGVQGAGILRISFAGVLGLLASLWRGAGPRRLRTLTRFLRFFLGTLAETYLRRPRLRPRLPRGSMDRKIPLYTLTGVTNAQVTIYPFSTKDGLGLTLTRFRRGEAHGDAVLLLHGLTSSSDMFIMPEHRNLVSFLLDEGYTDVWCLDARISNRFVYNAPPWRFSLDDVALFDYPAALAFMEPHLGSRKVAVISHCVGSLTFLMALFGGVVDEKRLRCVVANSVGLTPRVSRWARFKLTVAPKALPILGLPFISPGWHDYPGTSLLEKLMAWVASRFHRECDVKACHMLSLMWGSGRPSIYRHETIHPDTHARAADLFGSVGFPYYRHVLRMVRAGKAVKYDPGNPAHEPLPDDYLLRAREVQTPILFATGEHNRVFPGSNQACYALMEQLVPGRHCFKLFEGYGHQDVIIGKDAAQRVFPHLLQFLKQPAC